MYILSYSFSCFFALKNIASSNKVSTVDDLLGADFIDEDEDDRVCSVCISHLLVHN
jgi:hypothetical protein